jgi:regulator of protease activity HflC (stomatin/prohibitin superfamily)
MSKLLNAVMLATVMFMVSACGVEMVDTGHRGVKTNLGKVIEKSLEEGLYFYNPVTQDIIEMDVRTNSFDGDFMTYTKDVQQANMKITLMANPDKDFVYLLYRDYGYYWKDKILTPSIEGALKAVVGKWDAVDLIANREKAREEIETMLKKSLKDKFVEVIRVEMTNIDYKDEFEKAVENKVIAIQEAIEAQNRTKKIKEEAKQTKITAEAQARSMKIRADALAQNKSLVEYEAVQKWNGQMPTYMMGNTVPFINLGK